MTEAQKHDTGMTDAEKLRQVLRERAAQKEAEKPEKKKEPGTYDHTDEHTKVFAAMGIDAKDGPIERAWARLEDAGHNIGPAMTGEIDVERGMSIQYFMYAKARLDNNVSNVNQTVTFTTGSGKTMRESGL